MTQSALLVLITNISVTASVVTGLQPLLHTNILLRPQTKSE